jgi:hypothetical protein
MSIYYIYAYLRKDGTPYYIGKGSGNRAWADHKTRSGKPCGGIQRPEDNDYITLLETNLTELGAFALERRYIRWYGRKSNNTGILRNLTDGGDGISGWKHSEETKEKCRSGNIGKKRSEETKLKMRLAKLGKPKSAEHKANMSKAQKAAGNKPPPWTPDRKRKGKLTVEK